jgi:hypothetical protein
MSKQRSVGALRRENPPAPRRHFTCNNSTWGKAGLANRSGKAHGAIPRVVRTVVGESTARTPWRNSAYNNNPIPCRILYRRHNWQREGKASW